MQTNGCRVCIEIGHSKPDCKIIDLYNIDDPVKIQQIMNSMGNGTNQNQISNLSGIDHAGSYKNANKQEFFNLNEGLLDDDDEFDFD